MPRPVGLKLPSPPLASRLQLYAGIFLIFGSLGLLFDVSMLAARPAYGVASMVAMCGLIAVGWCHAFQTSLKWLWIVVPFSIVAPMAMDVLLPAQSVAVQVLRGLSPRHAADALIVAVMLVAGYILIVAFIRDESRRHERLQVEIALAARIHDSLVPAQELRTPCVEIFGRSVAGQEMGGDLLDVVHDGKSASVFIADVSGHGVAAGVVMAMVKSAIRTRLRAGGPLGALVRDLNGVLCDLTRTEDFVTFSAMQFDAPGRATFALAGHLPILHYRRDQGVVEELNNDHLPLGLLAEEEYVESSVACAPGDVFLMLTDGYIETFNAAGEQFGDARVRQLLLANASRPLSELYTAITEAVHAHGPAGDDQTLVLMRVL